MCNIFVYIKQKTQRIHKQMKQFKMQIYAEYKVYFRMFY